jgi:hypothetical protein
VKTLADFKRALTVGSKWEGFNHYYQSSFGVREVSKVQSNSFAFKTINSKGEETNSWSDFPKAKDIKFKEDGTVEIYTQWCDGYRLMLSYKEQK